MESHNQINSIGVTSGNPTPAFEGLATLGQDKRWSTHISKIRKHAYKSAILTVHGKENGKTYNGLRLATYEEVSDNLD